VVIECKRHRPNCCRGRRNVCFGRDSPRCQSPSRSHGERHREWHSTKPRVPSTIPDRLAYPRNYVALLGGTESVSSFLARTMDVPINGIGRRVNTGRPEGRPFFYPASGSEGRAKDQTHSSRSTSISLLTLPRRVLFSCGPAPHISDKCLTASAALRMCITTHHRDFVSCHGSAELVALVGEDVLNALSGNRK
jgi:hypothetical protein